MDTSLIQLHFLQLIMIVHYSLEMQELCVASVDAPVHLSYERSEKANDL